MTLLYYDPVFLEHLTGNHPESAGRIRPVMRHLQSLGLDTKCKRPSSWEPASPERLAYIHSPEYVESIRLFAESGGGAIEADTVLSPRSYDVARVAAGAACDAVVRVVGSEEPNAFCLVRPPGHHALPDHAMGFCLFNNVALAARVATRELGIARVLIVDWDVHHGNGTQAMFWEDPSVGFFSIHRWPFYPGTGTASQIGAGPGLGTTLNLPVAVGTPREQQLSRFEEALHVFAEKIEPELIIVSAGFDSHKDDPIGSLGLESRDFDRLTRMVLEIAEKYTGGRLISVLEGGYNPDALSECIEIHLRALLDAGGRFSERAGSQGR